MDESLNRFRTIAQSKKETTGGKRWTSRVIDRVYNINDSLHMIQTLEKIRQSGRQINYLVIAGHGSRDTPGIKFAKDDMIPEEIDLKWNEDQLALARRGLANRTGSRRRSNRCTWRA